MILLFFKIAFMNKSYVQSLLLYNICMYLTFYDIFTTYRIINKQFGVVFKKGACYAYVILAWTDTNL